MKVSSKPENYTEIEWQSRLLSLPKNLYEVKRQMRPEDIVGSYAVYHEEKNGDYSRLGGKNYRTGKAFHIYRPKVYDASGNWIYADLNINDTQSILSVTVNKDWLDRAIYPVRIDPNFGYDRDGRSNINAPYMVGALFSSGGAGQAVSMSAYMSVGHEGKAGYAIYDGDNFLSSVLVNPVTEGWNNVQFSVPFEIIDGNYWLYLWQPDTDNDVFYYDTTIGGDHRLTNLSSPSFGKNGDWPGSLYASDFDVNCGFFCLETNRFSVYVTYETPTPEIYSVTDSPDPVNVGSNITFEVNWNANDDIAGYVYVCTSDYFLSNSMECGDSSWGSGALITTPITIQYNAQSYDIGSRDYYVFLCYAEDNCTEGYYGSFLVELGEVPASLDVQGQYNFQGQVNIGAQ
jgi:hypothetical protein